MHISTYYPVYLFASGEAENFYANIYNYLLKRNSNKNGMNYPKYIYECNDNIETKKRTFRRKASNFQIDNEGMLYYKILGSNNDNDSSEEYDDISDKNHEIKKIKNF